MKNIPLALQGNLENLVVAYGEATEGERGRKRVAAPPTSWVAQRLGDSATFACTLIPPHPLSDVYLGHLELTRADFGSALSLDGARQRWAEFQRPNDIVVVLHPGTARLFSYLADEDVECLVLKSVNIKSIQDQLTFAETRAPPESNFIGAQTLGRATWRLADTIALVRHLNAVAKSNLVLQLRK